MSFKVYREYPTYKEVLKAYNELVHMVRDITTVGQAEKWGKDNKCEVEINGVSVEEYILNDGISEGIEWIRYDHYKNLCYIYCYVKNGVVESVAFDVSDNEGYGDFILDKFSLTQKEYYEILEEYNSKWDDNCESIGEDTEMLPNIKF